MSKPDKQFCEFCFWEDCNRCEKLKAYKQGREDAIEEVVGKSFREAVVQTSGELMLKFAKLGNWKQVKHEAISLSEIACGWARADELAEQMKGENR